MKKFLLFTLLSVFFISVNGQLTLEHTYGASATLTQLSISGYKYFEMDALNNQCKLYNTDHSLWKIIPLSIPSGLYLYDIKFVSETLFNNDSKVELAYIYYSYDTTYYYYTYYTKVINENGTELLSVPGAGYLELKPAGSGGTKMLVYIYNFSVYPSTINTSVYSLPGNLPTGEITENPARAGLFAFPNPAGDFVYLPVKTTEGSHTAILELLNNMGQPVLKRTIVPESGTVRLPLNDLPRGAYIYRIICGSQILATGSVIHE